MWGHYMDRLDRAIKILRHLPAHAVSSKRKTGQVNADNIRNRALQAIDIIRKFRKRPKTVDAYIEEAWQIYKRLQNLVGPEFFFDNTTPNPNRTISIDTMQSPNVRSGGMGFRHVNWDAEFMMAVPKGQKKHDPYYNPTSGKRDKNGVLLDLMDSDYWVFREGRKDEDR